MSQRASKLEKPKGLDKDNLPKTATADTSPRDEATRWLAENAEAIRLENEYIDKYGLPLSGMRLF